MSATPLASNSMYALDARRRITLTRNSSSSIAGERTEVLEERMKSQMQRLHILGIIEICLGVVCLLVGITATLTSKSTASPESPPLSISDGVWCSFVTIVAGAFGIRCKKTESNKCQIAFNLGFSLVASVFCATGILLVMEVMFIWINDGQHQSSIGLLIVFEVVTFGCMAFHIVSAAICCCNMQDMKEPMQPFLLHSNKPGPSSSTARISYPGGGGVMVTHQVSVTQMAPATSNTSNTSCAEAGDSVRRQASITSHHGPLLHSHSATRPSLHSPAANRSPATSIQRQSK